MKTVFGGAWGPALLLAQLLQLVTGQQCQESTIRVIPPTTARPNQPVRAVIGITTLALNDSGSVDDLVLFKSEAFLYGIDQFNKIAEISAHLVLIDSCGSAHLVQKALRKLFDADPYMYNSSLSIFRKNMVMAITDERSTVVMAVHSVLRWVNIPMISTASSADWLYDPIRYPLLLNMQPSNAYEAKAILEVAQSLKVESVCLVTSASVYGETSKEVILNQAKHYNICVENTFTYGVSPKLDIGLAKDISASSTLPKMTTLMMNSDDTENFISQVAQQSDMWPRGQRIFLSGPRMAKTIFKFADYSNVTIGSVYLASEGATIELSPSVVFNGLNSGSRNDLLSLYSRKLCDFSGLIKVCSEDCPSSCRDSRQVLDTDQFFKTVVMAFEGTAHHAHELYKRNGMKWDGILDSGAASGPRFWMNLRSVSIPTSVETDEKSFAPFRRDASFGVYSVVKSPDTDDLQTPSITTRRVQSITFPEMGTPVQKNPDVLYIFFDGENQRDEFPSPCINSSCVCALAANREEAQTPAESAREKPDQTVFEPLAYGFIGAFVLTFILSVVFLGCWCHQRTTQSTQSSPETQTADVGRDRLDLDNMAR